VEVDGEQMSLFANDIGSLLATAAVLALHLAAGVAAGVIFFRSLRWSARVLVEGGAASTVFVLTLGRFLLVGGALIFAAREGAATLLAVSVGVLVGRFIALRATERDA
jgi:F1F0 ATPase subunit 2